jgi:hypothetical protein
MTSRDHDGESSKDGNGSQSPAGGETPYETGNKKPPEEFRYKPGQSGNPKGRPRGSTSLEAKVRKELAKTVVVNKNGKSVKMSKLDVGVTRLVDRFMSGDLKSTAIILGLDKKNEKPKSDSEIVDGVVVPDKANLEFIVDRLQRHMNRDSGGGSDE